MRCDRKWTSARGGGGVVKSGHRWTWGRGSKNARFLRTSFMDGPLSSAECLTCICQAVDENASCVYWSFGHLMVGEPQTGLG